MSATNLAPATAAKAVAKPLYKRIWDHASILIIYLIMFVILSLTVPYFFSWENMVGLSLAISTVGIVACTMLFCLASGDFDLSVENIVATAGVIAAVVIRGTGNVWLGIMGGILSGGVVGLINGIIIAKLKINALITTLAMSQVVRGLGFIISGGVAVGILTPQFYVLGNNNFLAIPIPVWIMILCFVGFSTLLNRTTFGRNTMAIGGNREAARLAGIDVDVIKIGIFTIQGFISGLAGVVLASRMTSGQPNSSVGFSLDVISACVLGGVSLSGGIGTMLGVIVGVIIMGTVQNAMNLLNIPTFYQYVVRGIILLLAVLFDQMKQKQN